MVVFVIDTIHRYHTGGRTVINGLIVKAIMQDMFGMSPIPYMALGCRRTLVPSRKDADEETAGRREPGLEC